MFKSKDLLGLLHVSAEEISEILNLAHEYKLKIKAGQKKFSDLSGKTLVTLFYENSTRTRTSFELAGKYLGAHEVNISASSSSVQKGETLIDTGKTLAALGTDFIAIALSDRKNVDAWNYMLCCNAVLLFVAGLLFGWDKALYSIIFQFTVTQAVRALDPEGRRATLLIVTGRESAGGVCAQIQDTNHSATLIEGVGLYNGSSCVLIYTVVGGSQVRRLVRKIRQSDPNAFVNVMRTEKLSGRFYRAPKS